LKDRLVPTLMKNRQRIPEQIQGLIFKNLAVDGA